MDAKFSGPSYTLGVEEELMILDGETFALANEIDAITGAYEGDGEVKPGSPVECFAKRASAFNERLVGGERVKLVYDAERRDRFGRLLAYVYRARDGLFVNAELVRRGYATVATFPPNVRHEREFRRLARKARMSGRGLWSKCEGAG